MTDFVCSNLFAETLAKLVGVHTSTPEKEGFTPKTCPAGYWTEGYGVLVRTESDKAMHSKMYSYEDACYYSRVRTKKDALRLLRDTVVSIGNEVVSRVSGLKLEDHQIEALVFHAYNCGFSPTLYHLLHVTSNNSIISHYWTTHFVTAQGKPLRRLAIYRQFECTLYFRGWIWAIQVLHENNVL